MEQEQGFRKIPDGEIEEILAQHRLWEDSGGEEGKEPEHQEISDEELREIIVQHARWLDAEGKEGERANLRLADLEGRDLKKARLEKANLEGANLRGARLQGANLQEARLYGANLRRAILQGANLQEARLQGANLQGAGLEGANLRGARLDDANLRRAWLRSANLQEAWLYGANLREAVLYGANLRGAILADANLREAWLDDANLQEARLEGANLQGARLYGANLRGCSLRSAKLQGADLSGAVLAEARLNHAEFRSTDETVREEQEKRPGREEAGAESEKGKKEAEPGAKDAGEKRKALPDALNLHARQLAGADVSNAGLPERVWQGFRDGLANVAEASRKVDKIFVGLLAGCAYFGLVLALLHPGEKVKLPIINTEIPQDLFFWTAPLGLLLVFLYFQLNLQRLWERLAELPAIFEDGTPLDKKATPWLPVGYARAHFRLLREWGRPPLSRVQTLVIQGLAWWAAPATLAAMWLRYLHDSPAWPVCAAQIAVTMVMTGAALAFLRLARRTLRLEDLRWSTGAPQVQGRPFWQRALYAILPTAGRILFVAAVGAAMVWHSHHVITQQALPLPAPLPPLMIF
ncbi:MAG: pentapeptide repeat-containing protein [Desulfarculus sp.]|nr:MAG: pentapeptide repeat-containing protein [Desulfarculus sp.]